MLLVAASLAIFVGLAHSWLGEKYILTRLFRQPLPKLFGGDSFTRQTLRFAWHITSVAWFGFAALLALLSFGLASRENTLLIIGATFAITAVIALIASRGRHLSWVIFGAISIICSISGIQP